MEDYFNNFNVDVNKRRPRISGSPPPPSRVHSYPSYNPPPPQSQAQAEVPAGQWARYFGSCSLGYARDMEELCLRTGSSARRRRGQKEMVEKFSALTLGGDSSGEENNYQQSNQNYNNFYNADSSGMRVEPSRFQQQNIFQSKILTQQGISPNGSTLCFAQAQNSQVIRRVKMVEMGAAPQNDHDHEVEVNRGRRRSSRSWLSYLAVVFWILGVFSLIFLLKEQEFSQGSLWSGSGMLTMTMSANVSEWDGIWRASFTIRSDNSLILYILLIGAIVGLLRQIFD